VLRIFSEFLSAATSPRALRAHVRTGLSLAILIAACYVDAARAGGGSAPDFALRSLERGNQRLSEFRGQVVVLTFWASWCGECRSALPALNALYAQHRAAGLVVLGINLDSDPQRARDFRQALGIEFPVLLDANGDVSRLYAVDDMPLTIVIDRDGMARRVFADTTADGDLDRQVMDLLRE
jgi:peroxiredoxin